MNDHPLDNRVLNVLLLLREKMSFEESMSRIPPHLDTHPLAHRAPEVDFDMPLGETSHICSVPCAVFYSPLTDGKLDILALDITQIPDYIMPQPAKESPVFVIIFSPSFAHIFLDSVRIHLQ